MCACVVCPPRATPRPSPCLSQLIFMNLPLLRTLDVTPSSLIRPAANVYGTLTVGQTPVSPLHHSGCSMVPLCPACHCVTQRPAGLEGGLELPRIISFLGRRCQRPDSEPLYLHQPGASQSSPPPPGARLRGILPRALCALPSPKPGLSDPQAQR